MNEALQRTPEDEHGNTGWGVRLDAWNQLGAGTGLDADPSGLIPVVFQNKDDDYDLDPDERHLAQVDWLVENQKALLDALLDASLRLYRSCRLDSDEGMPVIDNPSDVGPLILTQQIHLTSLAGADAPIIGFNLWADWDQEHGIGIVTRGLDVISMPGTQHLDGGLAASLQADPSSGYMLDEDGMETQ